MAFFPSRETFQVITLTGNIVVSWPFSDSSNQVIADWNNVIGSETAQYTITLPDATLAEPGQKIIFNNKSIYSFQVLANDGTTVLQTITAGQIKLFNLNDISTASGGWDVVPFGGGTTAISSITAQSTDSSIVISNGIVTPPGGKIDFALPPSMSSLNKISTVGLPVLTNDKTKTWISRNIIQGSNIVVNNGDGVSGNPQIALSNTLTELTSIVVGKLSLSGSIISPTDANGISINSNGAANINLNGVLIDNSRNIDNINNLNITGTFNNIYTPKALCYFTDTLLGLSNSIITSNQANMKNVTGGAGIYTFEFVTTLNTSNYGVMISVGTDTAERAGRPTVTQGFCATTTKTPSGFKIAVVDSNGEYVTHAPNGITVLVLSAT